MATQEEVHFIGRIAQKAVIEREGKILMVRTEGEERFAFPGGRLNEGEDPIAGLVREVAEEIDATIEVVRPIATDTWISPKGEPHFLVAYLAHLPEGAVLAPQEGEIAELRWVGKDEIEDERIYPAYRNVLDAYFKAVY